VRPRGLRQTSFPFPCYHQVKTEMVRGVSYWWCVGGFNSKKGWKISFSDLGTKNQYVERSILANAHISFLRRPPGQTNQ